MKVHLFWLKRPNADRAGLEDTKRDDKVSTLKVSTLKFVMYSLLKLRWLVKYQGLMNLKEHPAASEFLIGYFIKLGEKPDKDDSNAFYFKQ